MKPVRIRYYRFMKFTEIILVKGFRAEKKAALMVECRNIWF